MKVRAWTSDYIPWKMIIIPCHLIDLIYKSQNASVPYPTMLHSEQKCAHFCSEWSIVGYGIGAFWDLWNWSIVVLFSPNHNLITLYHLTVTLFSTNHNLVTLYHLTVILFSTNHNLVALYHLTVMLFSTKHNLVALYHLTVMLLCTKHNLSHLTPSNCDVIQHKS